MLSQPRRGRGLAPREHERLIHANWFAVFLAHLTPRPDLWMSQHLLEGIDRLHAAVRPGKS